MIKPLNDFVIIKPTEVENKTPGGLIMLEESKSQPQTGVIVAVGEGRLMNDGIRIPLQVKESDKVIYARYAGTEVSYEGESYLLIREMDILAVID